MHTYPLAEYMTCIYRGDWPGVGELMLSSANKLAKAGADFLICPDNTVHQALPYFESRSPRPWLHIAEVVAAEAVERRFRRLALTGTRYLVELAAADPRLHPLARARGAPPRDSGRYRGQPGAGREIGVACTIIGL